MLLRGAGYSGSPERGPHLARQPPPWGPHSMQLPEIKDPVRSQAEQTVCAHSPASLGDGCASECISPSLSTAVFRYGAASCATSIFSSLTGGGGLGGGVFLPPPVQLSFRTLQSFCHQQKQPYIHPVVILPSPLAHSSLPLLEAAPSVALSLNPARLNASTWLHTPTFMAFMRAPILRN